MGVLRNAKHEAFAQAIAKGATLLSAYVLVGYRENAPNATRLAKNDKIRQRIDEIMIIKDKSFVRSEVQAANSAAVDKAWVLRGLVREAEKGEQSTGRTRAFELVGKELGMFIQRTEVGAPGDFANLDSNNAILDAVALELGAETAASLRAIISPQQTQQPMKVIEHDSKEVIEHPSRDCDDQ